MCVEPSALYLECDGVGAGQRRYRSGYFDPHGSRRHLASLGSGWLSDLISRSDSPSRTEKARSPTSAREASPLASERCSTPTVRTNCGPTSVPGLLIRIRCLTSTTRWTAPIRRCLRGAYPDLPGAQDPLGERFSVFAEVGLLYSSQRSESSSFGGVTDRTTWKFSTRTTAGGILYF